MASIYSSLYFVSAVNNNSSRNKSTASPYPFSQLQSGNYRKPNILRMSCSGSQNTGEGEGELLPRRRNVLAGLGGLGAAVALSNTPLAASAAPKFPLVLDSAVSTTVKRPAKSRSKKEKEEKEEVLVVDGIQVDGKVGAKFDVIVNDENYKDVRPVNKQFAGSFVSLPQSGKFVTSLSLGITDLLDDIGADNDDSILVTLVPRYGSVTIGSVKDELLA